MFLRLAAAAACVALSAAHPAAAAQLLTLDDAFERVSRAHPDLRLIEAQATVLAAERDAATLRPPLVGGVQIENALGTGELAGLAAAEVTLTLASVLERGGKLDARRTLAQSRVDALAVERETRRLDLLAEVARRYLATTAALHERENSAQDIAQRQRTLAAARERHTAGALPESVVLTAQANLARAELARARADQRWFTARRYLAALWGEKAPDFEVAPGEPLVLPDIDEADALTTLLESTPELARFASQQRIAEARLRLAESEARSDVAWQVGVRRLQAEEEFALVAGFQMPLGTRRRAAAGVRAASAEVAALSVEREASALSLQSTLAEAHGRYLLAQLEVARLREEVLPAILAAEAAAERAWRAGAASYLEWSQLQTEITALRQQQLDVALDAHRALIEIQRLTGQALVAGPNR